MKTINTILEFNEIIKKSKFLTFLHPLNSKDDIKVLLDKYSEQYKDATHICYSYILEENTYKYYDDGEPSNCAGLPIYKVLKNHNLVYVLCVVIRYYGGIKLGANGLVHAYANGITNLLDQAELIEYKKTNNYLVEITYSLYDTLSYFLEKKGIAIIDKQFLDNVIISINLDEEELSELKQAFPLLDITCQTIQ